MDQVTAGQIDISAILNTYVYMDEQSPDYHNKTLSEILQDMPDPVKNSGDYKAVLEAVNENPELGQMKLVSQSMCSGLDDEGKLIIACAFQHPNGDVYVAYRGTGDGKWVDNGVGIANESSQMQEVACAYFDQVVESLGLTTYDGGSLYVTGHSKGGNEAQYVMLNSDYGYLIDRCYSIDGQGFSQEAIDHFIEKHGRDYYKAQLEKMYSINGENDYVHDLGIVVIPEENTYFIETPGATGIGGYHDIKEMLNGAGLNWSTDADGNIISAEQGPIGQLARAISEKMQHLNQEDLEDCAVTIMSGIELLMPYNDVWGGEHKFGTGDRKFMTGEEFMGFLGNGLPMVIETLLGTEEGRAFLVDLISSGIQAVYEEHGIWGVLGVTIVATIAVPIVSVITGGLIVVGKIYDAVTDFIDKIKDVAEDIKQWYSDLKDAVKDTIQKIKDKVYSWTAGGRYAADHPRFQIDTYKMKDYASRLQDVNRRISNLDRRLDSLYWQVGLLDLWNLMQADLMTGYSWRLLRAASYLKDTALDFEAVERELVNSL